MNEPNPAELVGRADITAVTLVDHAIVYLQAAKTKLQPQTGPTPWQQLMHFFRHFRDNPVKNTLIVLPFAILIVLFVLLLISGRREAVRQERLRRESQSYVAQTQALDSVKSSLNSLLDFVQAQKNKLEESEDIVNALKAEQEKLKPVVETDRKVIDAILDLQSQRTQADVWKERGIGVVGGVLATLIGAWLLKLLERRRATPVSPGGEAPTAPASHP